MFTIYRKKTEFYNAGYSKFRPPAETNLQNLQKRLHEAAVEGLKKKTMNKKKKVKRN